MSQPLAVAANLMWLRPGAVGGTEEYSTRLLSALAEPGGGVDVAVAASQQVQNAHPRLCDLARTTIVNVGKTRPERVLRERRFFRGDRGPRSMGPVDVVHHLGGTVTARGDLPVALTLYDVQVLDFPAYFGAIKQRFLRRALPRAVDSADVICVMSEFVAASIGRHLGVARDRCRIVPAMAPAVDPVLPNSRLHDDPFVLYPAMTWAHKRHDLLIDAMERLPPTAPRLVLTGGAGPTHAAVVERIEASPARERIQHLGRVSATDLANLYRSAAAVVFASEYEGFGQPVLEAMAHGCPVIAADRAALPEVVGDGGVLLGDDPDAWAAAISATSDFSASHDRAVGALERVAAHQPAVVAAAQRAAYREAAGR